MRAGNGDITIDEDVKKRYHISMILVKKAQRDMRYISICISKMSI